MAELIVVAFRLAPDAAAWEPTFGGAPAGIARVRSLCSRGEALGARIVAWTPGALAMAWDFESLEESILLASSALEDADHAQAAWACGLAEGELEPFFGEDARVQPSWGEPLVVATALARMARPGEVLVDGRVRALREGSLSLLGVRVGVSAGRRLQGWRLDVAQPWKTGAAEAATAFGGDEVSTSEVLQIIDAAPPTPFAGADDLRGGAGAIEPLLARVGNLVRTGSATEAAEVLPWLRQARAYADSVASTNGARASDASCRLCLAMAVTLAVAGRADEALLEAVDALGEAREGESLRGVAACYALLSKLYASAGWPDAAARLAALSRP